MNETITAAYKGGISQLTEFIKWLFIFGNFSCKIISWLQGHECRFVDETNIVKSSHGLRVILMIFLSIFLKVFQTRQTID